MPVEPDVLIYEALSALEEVEKWHNCINEAPLGIGKLDPIQKMHSSMEIKRDSAIDVLIMTPAECMGSAATRLVGLTKALEFWLIDANADPRLPAVFKAIHEELEMLERSVYCWILPSRT